MSSTSCECKEKTNNRTCLKKQRDRASEGGNGINSSQIAKYLNCLVTSKRGHYVRNRRLQWQPADGECGVSYVGIGE